jgi:hypothetical protein
LGPVCSPETPVSNHVTPRNNPENGRNKLIHYCCYRNPLLVRILSRINQVHALLIYLLKIHFNIMSPIMQGCSKLPFSSTFAHYKPAGIPSPPYIPTNFILTDFSTLISGEKNKEQYSSLWIIFQFFYLFVPLTPKCRPPYSRNLIRVEIRCSIFHRILNFCSEDVLVLRLNLKQVDYPLSAVHSELPSI